MKAQVSTDFMIALGIALIVLVGIFVAADKRDTSFEAHSTRLYAKQKADQVASLINQVHLAGQGANATLEQGATLQDGTPYSMMVYPSSRRIVIAYGSREYATSLLTKNISGNLMGLNSTLTIRNAGGIVIE